VYVVFAQELQLTPDSGAFAVLRVAIRDEEEEDVTAHFRLVSGRAPVVPQTLESLICLCVCSTGPLLHACRYCAYVCASFCACTSIRKCVCPSPPQAKEWIDAALASGGAVLVHCHEGKSRSVTLLLAYLMMSSGFTLAAALAHMRRLHPKASPNAGGHQSVLYGMYCQFAMHH
jgi:hypothetical protein